MPEKNVNNAVETDLEKDVSSLEIQDNPLAREKIRKEQLDDLKSVDQLLNELPEGHKLSVTRVKPAWCEGHIDTFLIYKDQNNNSNISANDLRERFGGEVLMLRFMNEQGRFLKQRTITFADEPPKKNGVKLLSPEEKEERKQAEKERKEKEAKLDESNSKIIDLLTKLALPQNKDNNDNALMALMFQQIGESQKQAQAAQQQQMQMFMETMKESMNRTAPDPMAQFQQTMQIMAMSKELLGSNEPKDKDEIQQMMGGILELVKNKKDEKKPGPPAPPQLINPPLPAGPTPNGHPTFDRKSDTETKNVVAKDENEPKIDHNTKKPLHRQLNDLSAAELAELMADTLADMDDDKQSEVMKHFEQIGNDGGADYDE